jgi:hypothetical protein
MKYKGVIKKSKTMDYAALVGIGGVVLQTLPMIQDQLQGNYGYVFMAVSVGVAWLRTKTDSALDEK